MLAIVGADWALAEALQTHWPAIAGIPAAGTVIECGRPLLTIFAESASARKAL